VKAETIDRAIRDLVAVYGDEVRTAHEGTRTLARVSDVELPPGCRPPRTPMLIVFDPDQPKPIPYVQPGQLLANGGAPRSTSMQIVGGESWMQFSFNIPWGEDQGIIRFLASARHRFAQND
jgi:hypothetical protein